MTDTLDIEPRKRQGKTARLGAELGCRAGGESGLFAERCACGSGPRAAAAAPSGDRCLLSGSSTAASAPARQARLSRRLLAGRLDLPVLAGQAQRGSA